MNDNNSSLIKVLFTIIGLLVLIILILLGWRLSKFQLFGAEVVPPATSTPEIIPTANNQSQQSPVPQQSGQQITAPTVTTGYIPTCNWTRDWTLQPDGSYLWIGLPPGTPDCQNIGQAGELLQRLRNGENIKLIVNVGNTFVGLNICKGKYSATEIIPGEICVPRNPELWPKVKGTLIVTESDGFSVGTGK